MNLDGQIKETRWISNLQEDLDANEILLHETVQALQRGGFEHLESNKSLVWKNVDKTLIQSFVNNYHLYKNDPLGIKSRMPIDFIKNIFKIVN